MDHMGNKLNFVQKKVYEAMRDLRASWGLKKLSARKNNPSYLALWKVALDYRLGKAAVRVLIHRCPTRSCEGDVTVVTCNSEF